MEADLAILGLHSWEKMTSSPSDRGVDRAPAGWNHLFPGCDWNGAPRAGPAGSSSLFLPPVLGM